MYPFPFTHNVANCLYYESMTASWQHKYLTCK